MASERDYSARSSKRHECPRATGICTTRSSRNLLVLWWSSLPAKLLLFAINRECCSESWADAQGDSGAPM